MNKIAISHRSNVVTHASGVSESRVWSPKCIVGQAEEAAAPMEIGLDSGRGASRRPNVKPQHPTGGFRAPKLVPKATAEDGKMKPQRIDKGNP